MSRTPFPQRRVDSALAALAAQTDANPGVLLLVGTCQIRGEVVHRIDWNASLPISAPGPLWDGFRRHQCDSSSDGGAVLCLRNAAINGQALPDDTVLRVLVGSVDAWACVDVRSARGTGRR